MSLIIKIKNGKITDKDLEIVKSKIGTKVGIEYYVNNEKFFKVGILEDIVRDEFLELSGGILYFLEQGVGISYEIKKIILLGDE